MAEYKTFFSQKSDTQYSAVLYSDWSLGSYGTQNDPGHPDNECG